MGRAIAKYITQNNINPRRSILIGHSLGGHIAGAAGTEIKSTGFNKELRAIIGIDEAGFGFESAGEANMLDATDARTVISFKTSAWCGNQRHLATSSFFVNPIRDESGNLLGYQHPNIKATYRDLSKLNIEADRQSHLYGREVLVPKLLLTGYLPGANADTNLATLLSTEHRKEDIHTDGTPQLLIPRDQSLNSPPHAYVEQLVAIEDSLKRIFTD